MPFASYDARSLMLDGRRIALVGGALPYFRMPPELWRDRLLKARAAGLNCIFSPVPWNLHERTEGKWDFAAGLDVAAFVRMAGELGLYVVLGVGPYVGGDCDMGGLPSWLTAKSGVTLRSSGAAFIHYFDKYFRQLMPRLTDLQITRNGTLLMLQAEHHYTQAVMPDRQEYLQFITQLIRRGGMDIPIISDNLLSDPPAPDGLETARFTGQADVLYRLRMKQPKAPLLVSELSTGQGPCWGKPHTDPTPAQLARRAAEVLGCGCSFIYDPWHGGTAFGFSGAQLPGGPDSFTTTGRGGPILGEGGELTDAFYATRVVNMLAQTLGPQMAHAQWEPTAAPTQGPRVLDLAGTTGRWVTVIADECPTPEPVVVSKSKSKTTPKAEPPRTIRVLLPTAQELDVPVGSAGWAILPVGALLAGMTIDYSNLTPLGFFGEKLLILHGPAGAAGVFSIDGAVQRVTVPAGDEVCLIEGELRVAVINTELAGRTWPVAGGVLLGPTFVGENDQHIHLQHNAKDYQLLTFEGKLTSRKTGVVNNTTKLPSAPKLSTAKRVSGCEELSGSPAWTRCPGPQSVDALGRPTGYVWYRMELTPAKAAKYNLLLPQARDRVSLFLNGKPVGTFGAGADAGPLPLALPKGRCVLTALVDNLGRIVENSRLGEPKGLFGHLYDAKPVTSAAIKPRAIQEPAARLLPRAMSHLAPMLQEMPLFELPLDMTLPSVAPMFVSFRGLTFHAALRCNGRLVEFFESGGENFGQALLSNELRKGKNEIRLLVWGPLQAGDLPQVKVYSLTQNISQQAAWSWRAWEHPKTPAAYGSGQPAWFSMHFARPTGHRPMYVRIAEAAGAAPGQRKSRAASHPRKGQLFLNGHNLGRFWTIGPQERYYLPEPMLRDQNELLLFEETGAAPFCQLEFGV